MLSFYDIWLPFVYLYIGGGIFFILGLLLIRKAKALDLRLKQHRFWWKVLIFGYFYFMAIHASLIIAALYL